MARYLIFQIIAIYLPLSAVAQEEHFPGVNNRDRCRDFYQRREQQKVEQQKVLQGIAVLKAERAEARKRDRRAYQEFLRNRKPMKEDPRLEQMWLAEQKEKKAEQELNRLRYVQAKARAEKAACPDQEKFEMQEFDLEDYQ